MSVELENCSTVFATHDGIPMDLPSNCVLTLMVDVSVVKSADRKVWATGELTYTVDIKNDNGLALTDSRFEDLLDPDLIVFVNGSVTVTVNGTAVPSPVYNYDSTTGLLTVTLPSIAPNDHVVITFRVVKAP